MTNYVAKHQQREYPCVLERVENSRQFIENGLENE